MKRRSCVGKPEQNPGLHEKTEQQPPVNHRKSGGKIQEKKEKIPEKNGEVTAGKSVIGNDLGQMAKSRERPKSLLKTGSRDHEIASGNAKIEKRKNCSKSQHRTATGRQHEYLNISSNC
jgi:hypothetical protein